MKMFKKKWYLLGFILMLLISLSVIFLLLQRETYSKITDLHFEQLREKENIEVLDVVKNNDLEEPFAFVSYKQDQKIGAYVVRVINEKLEYGINIMNSVDPSKPVQVHGSRTGFPMLMVQINDDNLLSKGTYIYATFNQEKWHRLSMEKVKRNYIISGDYDEASIGRSSVQIYNGNNEVIFESG